ncbi:MAG: DNA repair protein RecN [Flavobacteriales bacterium]
MLKSLSISNYALIDQVNLQFKSGFTAITGETGSGKSILMDAFGLLLGDRADTKSMRDPQQKCVVEAVFNVQGFGLETFFSDHDLDFDVSTTIRRELTPGGKSRAFVNDTPVQVAVLRALSAHLVDVHSQHENSLLTDRSFQFDVLDAFANQSLLLHAYRSKWQQYKARESELNEWIAKQDQWARERDFIQFQCEELERAQLDELDQRAMEQELELLENASEVRNSLGAASAMLQDEQGILSSLAQLRLLLQKIPGAPERVQEFQQRVESCRLEMKELSREMEDFADGVSMDPERAVGIQDRLSQLYLLQKKHRAAEVAELIAMRDAFAAQLQVVANADDRRAELEREMGLLRSELLNEADKLSKGRSRAAQAAQKEMMLLFDTLQLKHAELEFTLSPANGLNAWGMDDVQLLFRANKGGALLPIKQVASGGEISRVMLALKAAVGKHKQWPTLILDEIDQGVSGEVARRMGDVLKSMSRGCQVMAITHLPQIAGKADYHMKVHKAHEGERTTSFVTELEQDARVLELAEMLSGKDISQAALENAREMMG